MESPLWSGGGSCDTEAPSDEEPLEDLAYTDTNPVTAGLVKWAHLWPGFTTYGWKLGEYRQLFCVATHKGSGGQRRE